MTDVNPNHTLADSEAVEQFCDEIIREVEIREFHTLRFRLGNEHCTAHILGDELAHFMGAAVAHLRTNSQDESDLKIYVVDEDAMGIPPPQPPWRWGVEDRDGYIHLVDLQRFTVNFNPMTRSLRLLDRERNRAIHWVRSMAHVPYWERSFPFREIINWWYRDTPFQPIHAAAVAHEGTGALIGAKGGSGKSSTAIACLGAGMDFAGDDFVLANTGDQTAYSLYSIAKLEPHALARFPFLTSAPRTEMKDQEKYQISLSDHFAGQFAEKIRIKLILIPKITGERETFLTPISKPEATSALLMSTLYLLKGESASIVKKISRLVQSLPTYQLNLGTELDQIPDVIKHAIINYD